MSSQVEFSQKHFHRKKNSSQGRGIPNLKFICIAPILHELTGLIKNYITCLASLKMVNRPVCTMQKQSHCSPQRKDKKEEKRKQKKKKSTGIGIFDAS